MAPLLILLLIFLLFILTFQYHWRRRHLYKLASKLDGPLALPVVGNGLKFMGKDEDNLQVIIKILSLHKLPVRFWFGPYLVIMFGSAEHTETILTSNKLTHKHDLYDFLKIYLGDGLITGSGDKHKKHRRIIQPLFSQKFVSGKIDVFQKHMDIFLTRAYKHVDKGTFDIHDLIHDCFIDIIGESVLGTEIGAQQGKNKAFIDANTKKYDVGYNRMMRPWLHPDIIYNLTSSKRLQDYIVNNVKQFVGDLVVKSRKRIKEKKAKADEIDTTDPIIDQMADITDKDPNSINNIDLRDHLYTIFSASEDTMTIVASMLLVCLGMYPQYQKVAAEEIRSVFGNTPREAASEDLAKLQYLDMCIKDVLRLVPIAPFIIRKTTENFHIDDLVIPKDCGVVISIFTLHYDPSYWENPENFYPDHFLPEAVRNRPLFAFIPFSAGARGCVGKTFAYMGIKLIMANILQRFEVEADGKFSDIEFRTDISVRSINGYNIRLKKRIWAE